MPNVIEEYLRKKFYTEDFPKIRGDPFSGFDIIRFYENNLSSADKKIVEDYFSGYDFWLPDLPDIPSFVLPIPIPLPIPFDDDDDPQEDPDPGEIETDDSVTETMEVITEYITETVEKIITEYAIVPLPPPVVEYITLPPVEKIVYVDKIVEKIVYVVETIMPPPIVEYITLPPEEKIVYVDRWRDRIEYVDRILPFNFKDTLENLHDVLQDALIDDVITDIISLNAFSSAIIQAWKNYKADEMPRIWPEVDPRITEEKSMTPVALAARIWEEEFGDYSLDLYGEGAISIEEKPLLDEFEFDW